MTFAPKTYATASERRREVTDPVTGQPWTVVVVLPGETPRTNDYRINEGPLPVVEFYDGRYTEGFGADGQYVAGYYVDSLVDNLARPGGLDLVSYEPTWKVSRFVVQAAVNFAIEVVTAAVACTECEAGRHDDCLHTLDGDALSDPCECSRHDIEDDEPCCTTHFPHGLD